MIAIARWEMPYWRARRSSLTSARASPANNAVAFIAAAIASAAQNESTECRRLVRWKRRSGGRLYRLTLISVLLFEASGRTKAPIHQYADYLAGDFQAVDGCLF